MIRIFFTTAILTLTACAGGTAQRQADYVYVPRPGQGQYQQPIDLRPTPTQRIPANDVCKSQFYRTLIGRHEGGIYFAGLPGWKRVVKPADEETFGTDLLPDMELLPPLIEIRDYLPDQSLYAPSVRTVMDMVDAGPVERARLTIELDSDGYVQQVWCG